MASKAAVEPRRLTRPTKAHSLFTLADQVVVSGSRFLITVMVARLLGETALGIYALVISIVYLTNTAQQCLVTTPYANFRHRLSSDVDTNYLRETWGLATVLACVATTMVALIGIVLLVISMRNRPSIDLWNLGLGFLWASLATPFVLMVEFARRIRVIRMEGKRAFELSVTVHSIIWLGIGATLLANRFNLATIFLIHAFVCGLASIYCIRRLIPQRDFTWLCVRTVAEKHWSFGRYIFYSEGLSYGRSNLLQWVVGAMMGIGPTGIYSACHSLMRIINPFFLGVVGVAEPTSAAGFATRGKREVKRIAFRVLAVMVVGALPICLAVSFASRFLLLHLYGESFASHWQVVVWLAATSFVFSVSYPFANALQAIDRPDINFRIRAVIFVFSVIGVLFAIPTYGLVGVAATHFFCGVLSLVSRIYFFFRLTKVEHPAPQKTAQGVA